MHIKAIKTHIVDDVMLVLCFDKQSGFMERIQEGYELEELNTYRPSSLNF